MSNLHDWTNNNREIDRAIMGDYSNQWQNPVHKPSWSEIPNWSEIKKYGLKNLKRGLRFVLFAILAFLILWPVVKLAERGYTSWQLARARSDGVFPTAEEGMVQMLEDHYIGITRITIFYAGPNSFDGSNPHVWYVTAEVHASSRADGSAMGKNGCDAPSSFFLQTTDGWVRVPEGAFPGLLGQWMRDFDLAGPGQVTPSIDRLGNHPLRFCQSP